MAVAAVVAYHLDRLRGGFGGVDVFFVVSGFLITRLLLQEHDRTGRIALGAFWIRRVRRLLPAALLVVPAAVVATKVWLPAYRLAGLRSGALAAVAYVANWRFVASGQSYFADAAPSPLRHLWSLSIEEQFYVVWPVVVAVVVRTGGRRLLALVAAVGAVLSAALLAAAADPSDLARAYYGSDTRAFALLAGAVLACAWPRITTGLDAAPGRARLLGHATLVAGAGLVALLALGVDQQVSYYRWGFQALAVLSVVVVAGLARGEGLVARALGHEALTWVGRRSYGLYLWSWPVQVFLPEVVHLSRGWSDLAIVAITVLLAAVSYELVEQPARLRTLDWPGRTVAWRAGTVAVLVLAIVVATTAGAPKPPNYLRATDDQVAAAALAPERSLPPTSATTSTTADPATTTAPLAPSDPGPGDGPFDQRLPLLVPPGTLPQDVAPGTPPLRVMVAGDSVGWSLGWELPPEVGQVAAISDRALLGCSLMSNDAQYVVAGEVRSYGAPCQQARQAEQIGLSGSPEVVVLYTGAWEVYDHRFDGRLLKVGSKAYADQVEARLQDRIDSYRLAGSATVLPLVPCYGKSGTAYGTERNDPDRVRWVNARIRAVADRNRGWVRLIDPGAVLCADGKPIDRADGTALRYDGMHFTDVQATWFWEHWLTAQLRTALAR
ncbi:acyltransferase [Aquihabitans sp. G128]|nr:acyltransferase [Aquihabitans sp. G128]